MVCVAYTDSMTNTSNESTRRAHQIAYDNRAPAEGEWCEGYDIPSCDLGTEVMSYTYCPRCRARAEIASLERVVGGLEDAIAALGYADDESHRVTTLRATLSAALREAEAERAVWEGKL